MVITPDPATVRDHRVWIDCANGWNPAVQGVWTAAEATTLCTILTALRPEFTYVINNGGALPRREGARSNATFENTHRTRR